ncbi:hypothetical protein JCM8115_001624 [Rhodotorula mucilaginosa]|uniref:polynucleotide adenylyltransferase n=1 Tax=Rhodotorula mucilaginosa TaxID=5537 RepID=A0A9P6VYX7_RHOMI|nr:hypothetical protein C6P46_006244 [Rhodotorula mucilaginosa]TKA55754.1 hypothetical protein B0A53_02890 [Rhodotorula sp. CCFEE 5036]
MAETTRAQFEQQEDFISFDASPPPQPQPPQLQSASTSNARKRRISDRHGPAPQDNDDEDDQQQGTRRLRDRERARSTPWCLDPGVDWARYARATDQLNAEAHAFVRYISPTPLEHELRLHTIELIRRTVRSKYPDSDVECFGSVGTGLYLPGGDIDLVVLSPSMPSPPLKPSSSLLHRLASLLLTSSIAAPQSLVVIAKARVPIVKFTTRYGGFSVDLSVNQKNGIDAAVRVRSILEEYAFREEGYVEPGAAASGLSIKGKGKGKATGGEEEGGKVDDAQTLSHPVDHGVARSLVLLVKAFLSQRGMNEVFTGGLGSYSIICMVVSFLQLHPRIQTAQINPNRNIGLLFVEFLELYGKHFNYDQAGITLKGRGGYFNKHDKGWYRPQQPYLLSIEDPNDPQNDVSGGSHAILRVRQTFAGGFDTLTSWLIVRESILASAANPSLVPLSAHALPNADSDPPNRESQSLLGGIIGLGKPDLDAREANARLYHDGVLQRLLKRTEEGAGGVEGGLMSRKAQKRAYQETKERAKRERTIARLERRVEEKERKREKRAAKKASKSGSGSGSNSPNVVVEVQPLTKAGVIEDALAKEAALEGLAAHDDEPAFMIDVVGAAGRSGKKPNDNQAAEEQEDDDDSRYSLGAVPAVARLAQQSGTASPSSATRRGASSPAVRGGGGGGAAVPGRYTHVTDDSSDSSGADDDDDVHADEDGDVVLGGGGGDLLVGHDGRRVSASASSSRDAASSRSSRTASVIVLDDSDSGSGSDSSSASSSSSSEVLATLVPASKRVKVSSSSSSSTLKRKDAGDAGEEKRAASKAKAAKRAAYWGAKGPKVAADDE